MYSITIWYTEKQWIAENPWGEDKTFAWPEDAFEAAIETQRAAVETVPIMIGAVALAEISRLLREGSSAVAEEKPPTAQVVIAALEALRNAELERQTKEEQV